MKIVPMRRELLNEYVEVFLKAFGGEPWNEPWTKERASMRLSQFMDTASAYGLAVEEEGKVVAFILGQHEAYYDGPRFYIQEFCCARQGGGLGSKLMAELEARLRERGVVRIYLMTIHGDATEGYYNRRGYVTDPDNIWMYKTGL